MDRFEASECDVVDNRTGRVVETCASAEQARSAAEHRNADDYGERLQLARDERE